MARMGRQLLVVGMVAASLTTVAGAAHAAAPVTVSVALAVGADDAEQRATGSVTLTSSDLELVEETGEAQIVGLRYTNLGIPPGATIHAASLQFSVDEATSDPALLRIRAETTDNAAPFTTTSGSIGARPGSLAAVDWAPPPWPTVGARGVDQQTPNLASLVQSAVSRPGWSSTNAIAFLIDGQGSRVAESYEGGSSSRPVLQITYDSDPAALAPSIAQVTPASAPPLATITVTGSGFFGTTGITIGSTAVAFAIVSDTELTTRVPLGAGEGVANLTVSNAAGTATTSITVEPPDTLDVPTEYATIQEALDAAPQGATVLVAPGVYVESIVINKTVTLASTFSTTGDPAMVDATVIQSNGVDDGVFITSNAGADTTLQGFHVTSATPGTSSSFDGVRVAATAHIIDNHITNFGDALDFDPPGPATCYCSRNLIENNEDDAIDLDGAAAAVIEGNILRNNGDDGVEIRINDHAGLLSVVIRDNIITGNGQDGIQIIDEPGVSNRHFVIDQNLIADNSRAGLGLMDNAMTTEDYRAASLLDTIHLTRNTFLGNNHGVSGGDSMAAVNNLFVGNDVGVKGVDGGSIVSHGLFWNNGVDVISSNIDAPSRLDADPLLATDYTLAANSPAVDAGIASFTWLGLTVLDLFPTEYFGAAPDLGAYELPTTANPPAAPIVTAPPTGTVGPATTVTLTGTAQPNVPIGVVDGFTLAGVTAADSNGDWSFEATGLAVRNHHFWVITGNAAGWSGPSNISVVTVTPG